MSNDFGNSGKLPPPSHGAASDEEFSTTAIDPAEVEAMMKRDQQQATPSPEPFDADATIPMSAEAALAALKDLQAYQNKQGGASGGPPGGGPPPSGGPPGSGPVKKRTTAPTVIEADLPDDVREAARRAIGQGGPPPNSGIKATVAETAVGAGAPGMAGFQGAPRASAPTVAESAVGPGTPGFAHPHTGPQQVAQTSNAGGSKLLIILIAIVALAIFAGLGVIVAFVM